MWWNRNLSLCFVEPIAKEMAAKDEYSEIVEELETITADAA